MSKKIFSGPFLLFILCGTLIPLGVIAYYGITDRSGSFTLDNILAIATPEHREALFLALGLALVSTVICLIIAFPLGLVLKDSKLGKKGFMVFIFILPMWMNFLLRTMAWQVLLEKNGIINQVLDFIGLPHLDIINTPAAVVLGMVYDYLPFMILPIYNALVKIDKNVIEAAYDLGASGMQVHSQRHNDGICAVPYDFRRFQHAGRRQGEPDRKYNRAGVYHQFQLEPGRRPFAGDDDIHCHKHGSDRKI